jgi:hypothetical protein
MKRIFPICAVAFLAVSAILPSCKKTEHETHPTPNNVRITGYTLIDSVYIAGTNSTYTVNDNYRFYYDESKRVSKIIYTTIALNKPNTQMMFTYKGDTIYKTTYSIGTQNILERDTFLLNSQGQIKTAYTPGTYGTTYNYEYFNGLLSKEETAARDSFGSVAGLTTYTSIDGDLLKHYHDGNVTAKFDQLVNNTSFSYKLDSVLWYTSNLMLLMVHTHVNSFTDVLNNYQGQPLVVVGKDVWGNKDTLRFPGIWYNQSYEFYTEAGKQNRPGDWMQLQSFTYFGKNIYENKHLVRKISTPGRISTVTYNIDADSKIKQTFVTVKDSALNLHNMKYDIQYEIF